MRQLAVLSVLVLFGSVLVAQEPAAPQPLRTAEQTKQLATRFLNTLATGTAFDAFALMKTAAPGSEGEIDTTRDTTSAMLDQLRFEYGRPVGYDLLAERTLGGSIIRYEALLKLEKNPIRCTITFYKATDTWAPVRVFFDEDIESLFIELGR